ncbi:DNA sulfur modification protein DndD [Lyngbya confervoides]|uniref:Nuclease SbcCD subunit C n=1 Tax=Lyngbya confervoides BDU141951 TaxID=1574623 RepID=A0ABD4SZV3_9CYAN|nr:DNA sulfur modification protein DndD [Lyngbya confervoides]MCM1981992.1 DNA sulfur modification protein DndD [Lyngbya confervoides BDU141951]
MIFRELILQNFGPYQGRQILDLSLPFSENAPAIVLLGGMNGGGKTTLLDAIRLALYGQRSQCSTRRNLSYGDFLTQCVNHHTASDAQALIELAFDHILDHRIKTIRVQRTWNRSPRGGRDVLQVLVDGWHDEALTKTWDEWIEALMPLGLSNLFLFDGEQIKELAEQTAPTPSVVDAMRSILGLELADRLSIDLEVLVSRKRKAIANSTELKQLRAIDQKLTATQSELKAEQSKLQDLIDDLAVAEDDLKVAQHSFVTQGGQIASDRPHLEAQLKALETQHLDNRQTLQDLASQVIPLALIQPLLEQAHQQAKKEVRRKQVEMARDLLTEREQRLLDLLAEIRVAKKHQTAIQNFMDQENQTLNAEAETADLWLDVDSDQLHSLETLLNHQLPLVIHQAQQILTAKKTLVESIEAMEQQLATAASPETYEKLKQALQKAQDQRDQRQFERDQSQQQCSRLERGIASIKKELSTFSEQTLEQRNSEHLIQAADKVQKILDLFREKLTQRKLGQLETRITECFRYLLHKENLIHRVVIDPETFGLALYDHEGQRVPKHRLSAGEKQILAVSLLWGLARAAGRQIPIIIDTPLGRLDSAHRHNLIERYFPDASHQVILLSTDTEIGQSEVALLRQNNAIARDYRLDYDAKQRCTTIRPGYFW